MASEPQSVEGRAGAGGRQGANGMGKETTDNRAAAETRVSAGADASGYASITDFQLMGARFLLRR